MKLGFEVHVEITSGSAEKSDEIFMTENSLFSQGAHSTIPVFCRCPSIPEFRLEKFLRFFSIQKFWLFYSVEHKEALLMTCHTIQCFVWNSIDNSCQCTTIDYWSNFSPAFYGIFNTFGFVYRASLILFDDEKIKPKVLQSQFSANIFNTWYELFEII